MIKKFKLSEFSKVIFNKYFSNFVSSYNDCYSHDGTEDVIMYWDEEIPKNEAYLTFDSNRIILNIPSNEFIVRKDIHEFNEVTIKRKEQNQIVLVVMSDNIIDGEIFSDVMGIFNFFVSSMDNSTYEEVEMFNLINYWGLK